MGLMDKLQAVQATVGVIGLGYVGLPVALAFAEAGCQVIGIDNDPAKIQKLEAGESYIRYIGAERVAACRAKMRVTTYMEASTDADALILCLPTPLGDHREPDLSALRQTLDALTPHLRAGQLVSLESTTYPGTTEEEILPRVAGRGLRVGEDFFVVYSPERIDPGNTTYTMRQIPKIVGGVTPACLQAGLALYGKVVDKVVPVSSPRVAELAKLLENIYRAVNIGLVNELKMVADAMGMDIREVIAAAATKPFGFQAFQPGPGLGGHCVPIDPFYLTWKASEFGVHTRFIELAGEINTAMPAYVIQRLMDALNERGKPLKGSSILVLGIAYKKNIDDPRESPAIELMEMLAKRGASVQYSDPHIPRFPKMRRYHFELESVSATANLAAYDAVILATDHDAFDYDLLARECRLLIDTRGRFAAAANVVRA
jgi:UDP-N-acetyl-D-glucosamine dehydrogenase